MPKKKGVDGEAPNCAKATAAQFLFLHTKTYNMKKLSVIVAMLMVIGVSFSSCSAGAHIGTKHHQISAGTLAH